MVCGAGLLLVLQTAAWLSRAGLEHGLQHSLERLTGSRGIASRGLSIITQD